MAKFVGTIGYATMNETAPGVHSEVVTERRYVGDIVKNTNRWQSTDQVNDDFKIDNQISILSDPYANEHFYAMKYVVWMGKAWKISNVEIKRPRILLTLGGLYNGETL